MNEQETATKPKSWAMLIALGIFVFALGLRLLGIGWGLKNDLHNTSLHPDEPVIFANSRAIEVGKGQFVPPRPIEHFYSYGSLYLIALRMASDITTTYGATPKSRGNGSPGLTDWDWIARCELSGRVISALAGAATALFVCLTLTRCAGQIAGGIAGLFMAVAPAHVVHSRFQTVDVTATFFLAVSLFYAVRIAYFSQEVPSKKGKPPSLLRLAMLCGVFAGLSAGTKYTGIIAIASLVLAVFLADRKRFAIPALAGVVTAFVVFLLSTPGTFLQTDAFVKDFVYEMQHTATGHGIVFAGTANGFIYTFTNLLFGIGPLLVLMGVAGLGYAAYRKHAWAWVMLAFFIPYYFVIGRSEVKFVRYSFPLYVTLAAGCGYLVQVSHRKGGWSRVGVGLGILGLGGVPFGGIASSAALTNSMMGGDSRDQAGQYLKSQTQTIGLVNAPWFWSPSLYPDAADAMIPNGVYKQKIANLESASPKVVLALDDSGQVPGWNMELLTKIKPPIIAFSSFEYFPVLRLTGQSDLGPLKNEVDSDAAFITKLQADYTLDKVFGNPILGGNHPEMLPEDLLYTDPLIYVWKRKGP